MSKEDIKQLTAHLFRENSGKMTAVLSKRYGLHELEAISDIVQDSFEAALVKWKYGGLPKNPSAWLMTVAKNKAINFFTRDQRLDRTIKEESESELVDQEVYLEGEVQDGQLRLLLTCCHPEISTKNQILLTLSILCGFGNQEIANGLFMKEEAVKKALTRSKKYLREQVKELEPTTSLDENRIDVVHMVLYLMFNEGYKSTSAKTIINHDVCYEAIRLTKLLLQGSEKIHANTHALLAIMFYAIARFPARTSESGKIVTLDKQDRSLWNPTYIKEGYYHLDQANKGDMMTKYHIEALISSIHCFSESFDKTDWDQIIELYGQLEKLDPSPLCVLNKIVAIGYLHGPSVALTQLERLTTSGELSNHYLLHAVEGDLLARLNKPNLAKRAFKKAHELSKNSLEQEFLTERILEL